MEKKLNVEGMMCEHCVAHVTKALEGVPGVSSVKVSLADKDAVVEAAPEVTDQALSPLSRTWGPPGHSGVASSAIHVVFLDRKFMPFKGLAGVVPRGPYSVMQICLAWQTPGMRLSADERGMAWQGLARLALAPLEPQV